MRSHQCPYAGNGATARRGGSSASGAPSWIAAILYEGAYGVESSSGSPAPALRERDRLTRARRRCGIEPPVLLPEASIFSPTEHGEAQRPALLARKCSGVEGAVDLHLGRNRAAVRVGESCSWSTAPISGLVCHLHRNGNNDAVNRRGTHRELRNQPLGGSQDRRTRTGAAPRSPPSIAARCFAAPRATHHTTEQHALARFA